MEKIKKYTGWLLSWANGFRSENLTGRVLVLCAASCFFPVLLAVPVALGAFFVLLFQRPLVKKALLRKAFWPLYILFVLLLAVPLLLTRWLGVIAGGTTICITVFFLLCCSRMTEKLFDTLLTACCFASYISLFYALGEKLRYGMLFRSTGGIYNANYYGTMMEFLILICVYQIVRRKEGRLFYGITGICGIWGILLCDCQSAWLAVFAGVLLVLYTSGKHRHFWIVPLTAVLLIGAALLLPNVLPRLSKLPENFEVRAAIWKEAWASFLSRPLFGGGSLSQYYLGATVLKHPVMHAHSIYLDPLVSYGLAGTAIWLFYLQSYLKRLRLKYRMSVFPVPLIAGLFGAVLVHGITDHTVLWMQTGVLAAILLSGAFAKSEKSA